MFKFLKKNKKEPQDLGEIVKSLENVSREIGELKKESKKSLQKIGLVRFNPFQEMGGEQSFSIALLDANNNGFVLTSHFGREANRVYAKPVIQGRSEYQLSEEEKNAINKAINA